MKNYFKILMAFVLVAIAFFACSNDDNSGNDGDGVTTNQAPSSFAVSVTSITETTASINWTEATDADGDTVTYTVTLQGSELASSLSVLTLDVTALTPSTNYSGTVVSSDGNGGSSSAPFSFSTASTMSTI